jgi:PhnB protein
MKIQSYLFFNGRTDEAIAFYQRAIGATDVQVMRYKDSPEPPQEGHQLPPGWQDKVMHASFKVGETEVMCSDGMGGPATFDGFSLVVNCDTDARARKAFDALADGGAVTQPLIKTFFTSSFGMLKDRFGVDWMVVVMPA